MKHFFTFNNLYYIAIILYFVILQCISDSIIMIFKDLVLLFLIICMSHVHMTVGARGGRHTL